MKRLLARPSTAPYPGLGFETIRAPMQRHPEGGLCMVSAVGRRSLSPRESEPWKRFPDEPLAFPPESLLHFGIAGVRVRFGGLRALEEPSCETLEVRGGGQVRHHFRRLVRGLRPETQEEPNGSGNVTHQIGLEHAGVKDIPLDPRPLESARKRVREQEIGHL